MLNVLGIDPGFAECGHAEVEVDPQLAIAIIRLGVIRTSKSNRKARTLDSDDNTRRLREIASLLGMMIRDANVVCSEALSDVRNARSNKLVAMTWGAVVAHASAHQRPILTVSPKDMRKRLGLQGGAGKDDLRAAMQKRFGKKHLEDHLAGVPESKRVHAYDALAAACACIDSEQVRFLLAAADGLAS